MFNDHWNKDGKQSDNLDAIFEFDGITSPSGFIDQITKNVCIQLHSGVIKSARRLFLDEIVSSIAPEFFALRKAEKHLKAESANKAVLTCSASCEKVVPYLTRSKR